MWSQKTENLLSQLNIEFPILLAPMAGGASTPELVAAVSNAGGLGSIGAGYLTPDELRASIKATRALTEKPFAVNLFIPPAVKPATHDLEKTNQLLDTFRKELNIPLHTTLEAYHDIFEAQLDVLLQEAIQYFSFTFGIPSPAIMKKLQSNNVIIMGTATTVAEGIQLEDSGCDYVIAQGYEAGGHRGTFIKDLRTSLIGTMALVPQLVDALRIPVIAAGGIMDGRGLAASLILGASAAQMGTAFLTCNESGINKNYKHALLHSTEESTVITTAFSGRPVRTINNKFVTELENADLTLPDYPLQNSLTSDIRKAAAQQNQPDFMSMYAGQGTRLNQEKSVADFMEDTVDAALELLPHSEF